MKNTAIVTDSGAYLPQHILNEYPISMIPFTIIWGEETFQDIVDISSAEFYTRLRKSKESPSTSQPSVGAFQECYQKLFDEGYEEILSIHVSSKLSGTFNSALQASQMFPKGKVEVFDSETVSMSLGFQVLTAARAAKEGASLKECKKLTEEAFGNTGVFFVVETLEYLKRGGRIGEGAAFLGNAFNLKPILQIKNGMIMAAGKVRTMKKAIERMLNISKEKIGSCEKLRLCVLHTNQEERAQAVVEQVRKIFPAQIIHEIILSEVSPGVGVHAGPGCIGLAFLKNM